MQKLNLETQTNCTNDLRVLRRRHQVKSIVLDHVRALRTVKSLQSWFDLSLKVRSPTGVGIGAPPV